MTTNINIKVLKMNLKEIFHKDYDYTFLFDSIQRMNDLVFICSHFIRCFILSKYNNKKDIPVINLDLIRTSFIALSKESSGRKSKSILLEELNEFYNSHFVKILNNDKSDTKFDAARLASIREASIIEMLTSYKNNITRNYEKYVRQFVNQSIKKKFTDSIPSDLYQIKRDILQETNRENFKSDKKYHMWINTVKTNIIPDIKKDLYFDLEHYPNKFLKCMLFMNAYLEENKLKMFQPISLRSDVKDKYITINTNALINMLPKLKHKEKYLADIRLCQKDIWSQIFNMKKVKRKGFSFNYQISTDGHGVSVCIIDNKDINKRDGVITKRVLASRNSQALLKDKTKEELHQIKNKKLAQTIDIKSKHKDDYKAKIKIANKKIKKLSKEEVDKIKLEKKLRTNEFNYIEDLIKIDSHLQQLKQSYNNNKMCYIDPGKRSPVTILRNDGKTYEYRTKRRLKETRRLKYNRMIDIKKRQTLLSHKSIKKIEEDLTATSGKSINTEIFAEYTKKKLEFRNKITQEKTYNEYLKRLKWYMYINTIRHTDKIVNEIKAFAGEDATLVIGDWGGKGNISYISTPNVGFQRRLKRDFKVLHIDEYNTSKIHHETKEKTENLKLNINGKMKKIHAVLTFKKSDGGMCCINRDKNAVKNMKIITESLLTHKKRPQEYSRSKNLNTDKTGVNSGGVNSGSENFTSKYQHKKIKITKKSEY